MARKGLVWLVSGVPVGKKLPVFVLTSWHIEFCNMTTNNLIWNIFLILATGVAVFGYDASGWWFLLSILMVKGL